MSSAYEMEHMDSFFPPENQTDAKGRQPKFAAPITTILLLLVGAILFGCSSTSSVWDDFVQIEKHTFPGRFHGEFYVYFSPGGRLIRVDSPTWYLRRPRKGPSSRLDQIPPTRVQVGMTIPQVESVLGKPAARVRLGMTIPEVENILGKPTARYTNCHTYYIR